MLLGNEGLLPPAMVVVGMTAVIDEGETVGRYDEEDSIHCVIL